MPMAKQARQIWTEKLGLVHPLPFSGVILREIGHLATIPIFESNQCKKSTNYKTRFEKGFSHSFFSTSWSGGRFYPPLSFEPEMS